MDKNTNIKYSIIVPVYNAEQYLPTCIDSILSQTLTDFELILVNDGSPDNCGAICDAYSKEDHRIKVIHKRNRGASSARNAGVNASIGEYIGWVDADDYINENTLQFMTQILLLNPDIGFVYSDMFRVDEEGNKLERLNMRDLTNLFNHGAGIMFRKSHLETIGLYDSEIKNCEDFDLLIRYFKNFDGYHIKLPLYRYTRHGKNMTSDKESRKHWKKKVMNKNKIKGKKR